MSIVCVHLQSMPFPLCNHCHEVLTNLLRQLICCHCRYHSRRWCCCCCCIYEIRITPICKVNRIEILSCVDVSAILIKSSNSIRNFSVSISIWCGSFHSLNFHIRWEMMNRVHWLNIFSGVQSFGVKPHTRRHTVENTMAAMGTAERERDYKKKKFIKKCSIELT